MDFIIKLKKYYNKRFYKKYNFKSKLIKDYEYKKNFICYGINEGKLGSRKQFYMKFKKLKMNKNKNDLIELTNYYNFFFLKDNNYKLLDHNIIDWKCYINNYKDLRMANINTKEKAIKHWLRYGSKEGRNYMFQKKNYKITAFMVLIEPEKNGVPYEYSIHSLLNICDEIIIIKDENESFSTNRIKRINKKIKIIETNENLENCFNILNTELKKSKSTFLMIINGNNIFPEKDYNEIRLNIFNSDYYSIININEYVIDRNNLIHKNSDPIKIINKELFDKNRISFKIKYINNNFNYIFLNNNIKLNEKYINNYIYKYLFYFCEKKDLSYLWYNFYKINNKNKLKNKIFIEEYKNKNNDKLYDHFINNLKNKTITKINRNILKELNYYDLDYNEIDKYKDIYEIIINYLKNNFKNNILHTFKKVINEYNYKNDIESLLIIYNNILTYKNLNYNINNLCDNDLEIIIKNKFVIHNGNLLNSFFIKEKPIYQSFWMGKPFTNLEYISVNSFIKKNYIFHIYTYQNEIGNLPKGVILKDASKILPKEEIFTYSNDKLGKSSISAFTNLFRFKLLYDKGNYWVDTDLVCIKKFNSKEPFFFTSEPHEINYDIDFCKKNRITSFIMKLPQYSYVALYGYNLCLEYKKSVMNGKIKWGMGPKVVKDVVNRFFLNEYVKPWYYTSNCSCHHFLSLFDSNYKLNKEYYKKMKIDESKMIIYLFNSVKDKYDDTYFIHLWNQFWNRNDIDKNGEFKKGSIMYDLKMEYL